jgi:hypothetical protein
MPVLAQLVPVLSRGGRLDDPLACVFPRHIADAVHIRGFRQSRICCFDGPYDCLRFYHNNWSVSAYRGRRSSDPLLPVNALRAMGTSRSRRDVRGLLRRSFADLCMSWSPSPPRSVGCSCAMRVSRDHRFLQGSLDPGGSKLLPSTRSVTVHGECRSSQ